MQREATWESSAIARVSAQEDATSPPAGTGAIPSCETWGMGGMGLVCPYFPLLSNLLKIPELNMACMEV